MPRKGVTVVDRWREFPDDTVVNGDDLFCLYCNHPLQYEKKSTVLKHMESMTHLRSKAIGSNTLSNKQETTASNKIKGSALATAEQPSPDLDSPAEFHFDATPNSARLGSSFVIKSRVLNRLRFSELEEGRHEIVLHDECTIFVLPCYTTYEGSKLGHLRDILKNEAVCLERAKERVWRLAADSSTVLTKLIQLGFSVASGSCDEGVHTWTLVDETSEEVFYADNDDPNAHNSAAADLSRREIARKHRHAPQNQRMFGSTPRLRDENADVNAFSFGTRPRKSVKRQYGSESHENKSEASSHEEAENPAKLGKFHRNFYDGTDDDSSTAGDRRVKKHISASASGKKRTSGNLYCSTLPPRLALNAPVRQINHDTINVTDSDGTSSAANGTAVKLKEHSSEIGENRGDSAGQRVNEQPDNRRLDSVGSTDVNGGVSDSAESASRSIITVEAQSSNPPRYMPRDTSSTNPE